MTKRFIARFKSEGKKAVASDKGVMFAAAMDVEISPVYMETELSSY
jgi:hypothetical protein